jgi:TFIIF-interacting CTD phosphatase-like protein
VNSENKLLILDLDETLIHASTTRLDCSHSDSFAELPNFLVYGYYIYKRPNLDRFIATCLEWFDVAVWTSSGSEYAAEIVSAIFPNPQALKFMWTRDRCSILSNYNYDFIDGHYPQYYTRKPLWKVKRRGYSLESIIAIDDTPKKWEQSYGNLIAVKPFQGDRFDRELEHLLIYLDTLRSVKNIRSIEKRWWRDRIVLDR